MSLQNISITKDFDEIVPQVASKIEGLTGTTILIAGGGGFLGCWVSEFIHYLNKKHEANITLYLIDRNKERFDSLPHLASDPSITFIAKDIRNVADIPPDVNYIINATGTPDNRFHFSNPIDTMSSISISLESIIRSASRLSNLKNIVHLSSSAVYESNLEHVNIDESFMTYRSSGQAKDAYSVAKLYSEVLCSSARSELKLPVVIVRPFTFCGGYQSLDSPWALNNFINDALHNRPIKILGDGSSVRSYLYGADAAAWLLVMTLNASSGQVINMGSQMGIRVEELAQKVSDCFSTKPSVILNTSMVGSVPNSYLVPDTSRAKSLFGLTQYTLIDDAISKTVQWYKEHRQVETIYE